VHVAGSITVWIWKSTSNLSEQMDEEKVAFLLETSFQWNGLFRA
jgi:hypothetical protein